MKNKSFRRCTTQREKKLFAKVLNIKRKKRAPLPLLYRSPFIRKSLWSGLTCLARPLQYKRAPGKTETISRAVYFSHLFFVWVFGCAANQRGKACGGILSLFMQGVLLFFQNSNPSPSRYFIRVYSFCNALRGHQRVFLFFSAIYLFFIFFQKARWRF